jgi:alkylhydroperoxidase family enzyme
MAEPPSRIPLLNPQDLTDAEREVFRALGPVLAGQPEMTDAVRYGNHVYRTFAQHPALAKSFLQFNGYLLSSATLPIRIRQIAIHRVAWIRHCVYMWSSHLRVSLPLGLKREDFEAIKVGAASSHWTDFERALITAVDQLVERSVMTDELWAQLSAELSREQMMDLLFMVGCYVLLAMVFNSVKIEREPELQALAAEYGAPDPMP